MTRDESPIVAGHLGVHVLSDRLGESTIVTLPDGSWFVVDAYQGCPGGTHGPHAVHTFIERFDLAPEDCLFVLLTHLHEDHYNGIPSLLTRLRKVHPELLFATHAAYRGAAVLLQVQEALEWREDHSSPAKKLFRVGARVEEVVKFCRKECLDVSQWNWLPYRGEECQILAIARQDPERHEYRPGGDLR